MDWYWHCSWIKNVSQDSVIHFIKALMHDRSNGRLYPRAAEEILRYHLVDPRLLFYVSPTEDGWVAVWGGMHVLQTGIFQQHSLSGLVLCGGMSEPGDSEVPEYWEVLLWEGGRIMDWFYSEREDFAKHVREVGYSNLVEGYLRDSSGMTDVVSDDGRIILEKLPEVIVALRGDHNIITPLLRPEKTSNDLSSWFSMSARRALSEAESILNLPWIGHEYDIHRLAWISDYLSENVPIVQLKEMGYQPQIHRFDEFVPIVFQYDKELSRLEFDLDLASVLYYPYQ